MSSKTQQRYVTRLHASVVDIVNAANGSVLPERRVPVAAALEVANRSYAATKSARMTDRARAFAALRAVGQFVALATKNKETSAALAHSDLLPVGHPASTASHAMTASALRHAQARWIAADPFVHDSVRALVADAYSQAPGSVERIHAFARVSALPAGLVPLTTVVDTSTALTAAFGFGLGGNSSAARRARAMLQRRDRRGRFAFMGGMFHFKIKLRSGNIIPVSGRVVGAFDSSAYPNIKGPEDGIQIELDKGLGTNRPGIYIFPSSKGESAPAMLSEEYLKEIPGVKVPESLPDGPDVVSENDVKQLGMPIGWLFDSDRTTSEDQKAGFIIASSPDGYFARIPRVNQYEAKNKDQWTLHRANLEDNSVGEEVGRGSSWADLITAAEKDQNAYEKVLLTQDEGSDNKRPKLQDAPQGWTYDEKFVQQDENGFVKFAPFMSPDGMYKVDQRQKNGKNSFSLFKKKGNSFFPFGDSKETWDDVVKALEEDAPNLEIQKKKDAGEIAPQDAGLGKEFVKSDRGMWLEREVGADYNYSDAQLEQFAEQVYNKKYPLMPNDPKIFNKKGMGWHKDSKGKWFEWDEPGGQSYPEYLRERKSAITSLANNYKRLRDAQDLGTFNPSADGPVDDSENLYKEVSKGVESKRTEPQYTGGLSDVVDLVKTTEQGKGLGTQVADAIKNSQKIRFSYNGKNVTITPVRTETGKGMFERNVVAKDGRRYSMSKMGDPIGEAEAPAAAPAPAEGLPETVDLNPDAADALSKQINDAISNKQKIRFGYNGTDRTITPTKVWTNPKNQNINVTADDGKNYTVGKMSAPKPVATEAPTPEAPQAPEAPAVETPTPEVPTPEGGDVYLDTSGDIEAQINEAAKNGQKVRFNYSGKERVVEPQRVWTNPKNGNRNLEAIDQNGDQKNFTLSKIEQAQAPAPVPEEVQAPAIGEGRDVSNLSGGKLRSEIQSAIDAGEKLSFNYHDKPRVVDPIEIWENPKTGKVNLRAIDSEGNEKNFTLDKFGKPVEEKVKQTQLDDIINMPQEELDDLVDALWPAPAPEQAMPEQAQETAGLQEIDTKNSTAVARMAYSPAEKTLYVQFQSKDGKGGGIYAYDGVEQDFVDRLVASDSIGKMIPELKNNHTSEKINEFPGALGAEPEAPQVPEEQQLLAFDEPLFDSMFTTPDGAYKPNIFSDYAPQGRTSQDSADYTDDPSVLSTKFPEEELAGALMQAVLPLGNEPATGRGNLQFDSGEESVSAEALMDALNKAGVDSEVLLAGIYDRALENNGLPADNVRSVLEMRSAIDKDLEKSGQETPSSPPRTVRTKAIDEAKKLNARLAEPQMALPVVQKLQNFEETNPKIFSMADTLKKLQDDGTPFDEISYGEFLDSVLPLATSKDPEDREAFKAFWGWTMSLDGGDTHEDDYFSTGGLRTQILNGLDRQTGSIGDAIDAYENLLDEYGGVPEFVDSKRRIAEGQVDISDDSTGGAFFRLVKASARTNTKPLWRSIGVTEDDPNFAIYTTEGSTFSMDPRSFTSTDLQTGTPADVAHSPTDPSVERVIFRIDPGNGTSVSSEAISPFPEEFEHFAYGTYEVQSVTRQKSFLPGRRDDYVVTIKETKTQAPEQPSEGQRPQATGGYTGLTDYGDVSDWTRVGEATGSNDGGFYEAPDGSRYYAKVARSQSHADNEMLASAFYRELGIKSTNVGHGIIDGDLHVITPLIPGASKNVRRNVLDGDQRVLSQLRDAFAVDAWLANYDVMGLVYDNVVTDENGDAVRVDPGGALMWRARGGAKEWFDDKVDELDTMRNFNRNESAATVFDEMTQDDIRESARRYIAPLTPSRIDEIIDSVITDKGDAEMLKERMKRRREDVLNRLDLTGAEDILGEPVSLKQAMGYPAQDLLPGDVTSGDSFTIERIFKDDATPKGKVSVQGYYPGHESQRKEWNEATVIDAVRGGTTPPKGDKPALHRPKAPYEPAPPAFTGSLVGDMASAKTWADVQNVINGQDIIFFDYETTGFPDKETGEINTNKPVQLGAVRVRDGEVVDRFNVFMNPGEKLGTWSRNNLLDGDGNPLTDDWLNGQVSVADAHNQFIDWIGDSAVLGGHNVPFDRKVFESALADNGLEYDPAGYVDTLRLARDLVQKQSKKNPNGTPSHRLGDLTAHYGIELTDWHTADADAAASAQLLSALLADAAGRPDADTSALDFNNQFAKYLDDKANFDAAKEKYADELAQYEVDKAIAAAWDCNNGGGGITSAGNDDGSCNVPSLDDLIKNATPQEQDFVDPDGIDSGSTSKPSSYVDNGDEIPEFDGVDTRPDVKTAPTGWPPVDDPDDKFKPTPQQQAVFEAVFDDKNVVIRAAAGAGKTSTLVTLANRITKYYPDRKIVYIAFNRSVADEGRSRMPSNTRVYTADALARTYVAKDYPELIKKFNSGKSIEAPTEIAQYLGIPSVVMTNPETGEQTTLKPKDAVKIVRSALYNFKISQDAEISEKHFEGTSAFDVDVTPELMNAARRWWDDVMDPNGKLRFSFGEAKKIWSLSEPDFSSTSSGLDEPADYVFVDEAQDTNDVLGVVVANQPKSVHRVIVGDSNQAIYSFMGANDWLDKVNADVELPLTQSWRFNQEIANSANKFLILKERIYDTKMKFVVEGGGPNGEIVPAGTMDDADVVLVRSNAGAFGEVLSELENNRTVGVTASFYNDMTNFASGVEWLKGDPATRGTRPAVMPEEIRGYTTWQELVDDIAEEDSDISNKTKILVDIVGERGVEGLREIVSRLKKVKGSGQTKELMTTRLDLPTSFNDGANGEFLPGVTYSVEDGNVYLGGKTFAIKEQLKSTGLIRWDGDKKAWVLKDKNSANDAAIASALKKLQDAVVGPSAAEETGSVDVIISTVHQAKGMEYPNVRIGGDFPRPRKSKKNPEETIWPSEEELHIAYVAVTRAEEQLDMGSLDWINKHVSQAEVESAVDRLATASAKNEAAPDISTTEEPNWPAPTVPPELVDEVADTPESVVEDPTGEAPMPEPSSEKAPELPSEGPVAETKAADLSSKFDEFIDFADQITDPEATGDLKMKPSAVKKAQELSDEISKIRELLDSGAITQEQALAQLNTILDALPDYDGNTPDQINMWTLVQYAQDVRNILDGTFYQRPTAPGLPPIDAVDSKGRPVGYSKDGVFLNLGMRVRDKWGYAGTVEAYNEGDWINVYIRYDIDPRDPEKVKKGNWGPGVARVSKNPNTLTVLDPNDDQPWVDTGSVPENKKPKRLDEQVEALKSGKIGKGEKGGGLPKVKAPEGATPKAPAARTESPVDQVSVEDVKSPKFLIDKSEPQRDVNDAWLGMESPGGKPDFVKKNKYMQEVEDDFAAAYDEAGVKPLPATSNYYADPVRNYQALAHKPINALLHQDISWLGTGPDADEEDPVDEQLAMAEKVTKQLDALMSNVPPLDKPLLTFRGVSGDNERAVATLTNAQVGDVFADEGFVSSSLDLRVAHSFMGAVPSYGFLLEIVNPEGTRGVMANGYLRAKDQDNWGEHEWILDRGTKFQVLSKSGNVLRVVVVGQSDDKSIPDIDSLLENGISLWQGANLTLENNGNNNVTVARGLSSETINDLKRGAIAPPVLPFFVPMGDASNDGEGYYFASNGKRYWGKYGAAGALLARPNEDGVPEFLLGRRANWISTGGGKWAYPGGAHANATDAGNPLSTALKELQEELKVDIPYQSVVQSTHQHDSFPAFDWNYKTFIIPQISDAFPEPQIGDIETSEIGWFTADQIKAMRDTGDLHTDFAKSVDAILSAAEGIDWPKPEATKETKEQVANKDDALHSDLVAGLAELFMETYRGVYGENAAISEARYILSPLKDKEIKTALLGRFEELLSIDPDAATQENIESDFASTIKSIVNERENKQGLQTTEVIETGRPPYVPQNPKPISASGLDGVMSLVDAIQYIGDDSPPLHPGLAKTAVAAIDSGDVEDLEVRVMIVSPEDNPDDRRIRIKFKLTPWAAVEVGKQIKNDTPTRETHYETWQVDDITLPFTVVDPKTGVVHTTDIEDFNPHYSAVDIKKASPGSYERTSGFRKGSRYTLSFKYEPGSDRGARIDLTRSNNDPTELAVYGSDDTGKRIPFAFHNQVTIDAPIDATTEEIEELLRLAGVRDVRAAEPQDLRTLAENKLLSVFKGDTDPNYNIISQEKRKAALEEIAKDFGVTADDVQVRVGHNSHLEFIIPDDVARKVSAKTGMTFFTHTVKTAMGDYVKEQAREQGIDWYDVDTKFKLEKMAEYIANLIESGGLVAGVDRLSEGKHVRGWSGDADITTGGANYIFATPEENPGRLAMFGYTGDLDVEFVWDGIEYFKNLSIFANSHDAFGFRTKNSTVLSKAVPGSTEILIKHGLSFDSLFYLAVGAPLHYELIKKLKEKGINEIGGRPVEEAVAVFSKPPAFVAAKLSEVNNQNISLSIKDLKQHGISGVPYNEASYTLATMNPEATLFYAPAPDGSMALSTPALYREYVKPSPYSDYFLVEYPDGTLHMHFATGEIKSASKNPEDFLSELGTIKNLLINYNQAIRHSGAVLAIDPNKVEDLGIIYVDGPGHEIKLKAPSREEFAKIFKSIIKEEMSLATGTAILSIYLGMHIPIDLREELLQALIRFHKLPSENPIDPLMSSAAKKKKKKTKPKTKVLPLSSFKQMLETNSFVNDYVVVEVMSGSSKGLKRITDTIYQLLIDGQWCLYIPTDQNSVTYPLEKNTQPKMSGDLSFCIFSSRGIKYKIRPIDEADISAGSK